MIYGKRPSLARNRTSMKSEQTTLVCWGLKGLHDMKKGLIQRQPGRRVPNDTQQQQATVTLAKTLTPTVLHNDIVRFEFDPAT